MNAVKGRENLQAASYGNGSVGLDKVDGDGAQKPLKVTVEEVNSQRRMIHENGPTATIY